MFNNSAPALCGDIALTTALGNGWAVPVTNDLAKINELVSSSGFRQ